MFWKRESQTYEILWDALFSVQHCIRDRRNEFAVRSLMLIRPYIPCVILHLTMLKERQTFCHTVKSEAWYRIKWSRTVLLFGPTTASIYTLGISLYVFMRALFQVISILGINLICWTKINAVGRRIVPQLGFNRSRWNQTDLQGNQNRNCNGACQVWIPGAGLYKGKPSKRARLITFRWPESGLSEVLSILFLLVCTCPDPP